MKKLLQFAWRWLRYLIAFVAILLALMALIPWLFPGPVNRSVKKWANESLNARLDFSKTHLSFFRHFPALTLSLDEVSLMGSAPFQQDTLLQARELALGVNLWSVFFEEHMHIDKIFLVDGRIDVQVNKQGEANYNVYKSTPAKASNTSSSDSSSASLKLNGIILERVDVAYRDASVGLDLMIDNLDYAGMGDLDKSLFDLNSELEATAVDLTFDGQAYLRRKQLRAELITRINTNSLKLIFERNLLRINKLPIEFTGTFDFLTDGYEMDFRVATRNANLAQLATALPPAYQEWVKDVQLAGDVDARVVLGGEYSVARQRMPSLQIRFQVNDGRIQHMKAPAPVEDFHTRLAVAIPALNMDSMRIDLDSLHFKLGSGYARLQHHSTGLSQMALQSKLDASLDLATLDTALAIPGLRLAGALQINADAHGSWKPLDNVLPLPKTRVNMQWTNGALQLAHLPDGLKAIQAKASLTSEGKHVNDVRIDLDTLSLTASGTRMEGSFHLDNLMEKNMRLYFHTIGDLGQWNQCIPLGGWKLGGQLQLDVAAAGSYRPELKRYPVAQGTIRWKGGLLQTPHYPQPISAIETNTAFSSRNGNLAGVEIRIQPLRFSFEQQPMELTADMKNFDVLQYAIRVVGKVDIGHLTQVFPGVPGQLQGIVDADLQAAGNQADVLAKRFQRLKQSGSLVVRDLVWRTSYLPQLFEIPAGTFRFQQDKMWFNRFLARVGGSDLQLDGYFQDAIGHWLNPSVPLHGRFEFRSKRIRLVDFMSSDTLVDSVSSSAANAADVASGVVDLPPNWDIQLKTRIDQFLYGDFRVDSIQSNAYLRKGRLGFDSTRFSAVGTQVAMQGYYEPQTKKRARFSYSIEANDFDIKRAYKEVPLFRQMASAAAYASGIISLQYKLDGRLDAGMKPVLPSLIGGGEIRVQKVKLKGFRLLNTVSRETGKSDIRDPDLSRITIRSQLANNVLTLERFKMKMAGFRLRMEGQTRLDGALKLRMRLGLPPLGIIGIPMRVTGTHSNPKVKLGKGDNEPLEQTADKDDEE